MCVYGLEKFSSSKEPILALLASCCFWMQRSIHIQDRSGLILQDHDAREAGQSVKLYLRAYVDLAAHYFSNNRMLFKIRHKTHYMTHVCAEIEVYKINQKVFATWGEESFLGKLKSIATKCHGKTVTFRIYQRYLLAFAIFLQEHRRVAKAHGIA